jgi:APA family basic amino acid/polyamine antiporter
MRGRRIRVWLRCWLWTAVNYRGVAKTAAATRVLVGLTLVVLAAVLIGSFAGGATDPARLSPLTGHGAYGVLQAAGLLFFAFAGYARIATLGEEMRDPARTIPRAVPLALGIVVVIYALVGISVLLVLGAEGVATSIAPLQDAVRAGSLHVLAPLVRVGGGRGQSGRAAERDGRRGPDHIGDGPRSGAARGARGGASSVRGAAPG